MLRSLRSRLLSGAVLWTAGLFAATLIVSTTVILSNPRYPRIVHGLAALHGSALTVFAVACMILGVWQVRRALASVTRLRTRLSAVHAGDQPRVDGSYPTEVQPLVDDLNALLAHREQMVRRALAKAGDLAHGLKTPLAVLSQEADRADAAGQPELAAAIAEQVDRMRRQVHYHLAQARAAASGATPGARSPVAASTDALDRTMRRLHAGRGLAIDRRVAPDHAVRCQREDLDEMLGNLLDNACKWAKSRVQISSSLEGADVVITVDDDGPGIAASMRDVVLQRGVRADEAAPGSGLGLAIVQDLAELYGGSIALDQSALGGLRARLRLPGC